MDFRKSVLVGFALTGAALLFLVVGFSLGEPWSIAFVLLAIVCIGANIALRIARLVERLSSSNRDGPGSWPPPGAAA